MHPTPALPGVPRTPGAPARGAAAIDMAVGALIALTGVNPTAARADLLDTARLAHLDVFPLARAVIAACCGHTTGADPAIDRKKGFDDYMAGSFKGTPIAEGAQSGMEIIASQTGNFTRDEGRKVMETLLQAHPEVTAVYAHNDEMAIGAIAALEAAGRGLDAAQAGTQAALKEALQRDPRVRQALEEPPGPGRVVELMAGLDRERERQVQLTAEVARQEQLRREQVRQLELQRARGLGLGR